MLLLRQLFDVAGGGPETDAFKHLAAAFTVLRSLGSAKTSSNSESSRIGHFIEVQVTDGALYRTKIHCYFLDQTRVIRPLADEKNYHIFYQMLAGLTPEERGQFKMAETQSLTNTVLAEQLENRIDDVIRADCRVTQNMIKMGPKEVDMATQGNKVESVNSELQEHYEREVKLNLEGYSPSNLSYLQHGDTRQDEADDAARFQAWKACLGVLGIPFLDVVRELAAVLLLGNVQFMD
ncbi:Myosin [Homalodisca vitripennis]|nr:Myosin [Homalodisca vitripennis]